MDNLREYIKNWIAIEGQKPENEEPFVNGFIELVANLNDERDVSFDGEGAYFGKQVRINLNSGVWIGDPLINFEIAYSEDQIRVYTANHHGYWNPEYLSMTKEHPRFNDVKKPFFKLLYRVFGLPECN